MIERSRGGSAAVYREVFDEHSEPSQAGEKKHSEPSQAGDKGV